MVKSAVAKRIVKKDKKKLTPSKGKTGFFI
jgi:hypothetical protein